MRGTPLWVWFQLSSQWITPHMRGTPAYARANLWSVRITPHMRGNTRRKDGAMERQKDHPRTCGEHVVVCAFVCVAQDHPAHAGNTAGDAARVCLQQRITPHMRGTLSKILPVVVDEDHPAHAGNTWSLASQGSCGVACQTLGSPRTCGEHGLLTVPGDNARDHPRTCVGEHCPESPRLRLIGSPRTCGEHRR